MPYSKLINGKRLTQIKAKLATLSKDREWVAGIADFARYFGDLQRKQNAYFAQAFPEHTLSLTAQEKNELLRQMAVQNTMEALMGDGLKANVTDKLNDILLRAVTTGTKFADLQEELRAHLLGKDGGQGAFARYATTYATTALSQYTGQHNKLLSEGLDTEWYMYTGSNKETTREFCEYLTKKKYIHKSEIPTILTGLIDDHQCAIYPKTNLPYGMIEGTTPENFQCNCGGWNCRHQLIPVADAVVPAELRAKFKQLRQKVTEEPQSNVANLLQMVQEKYPNVAHEYQELKENGDFARVELNQKGGLFAVHRKHNTPKKAEKVLGDLTGFDLEMHCARELFDEGYVVILQDEGEKYQRVNDDGILVQETKAALDAVIEGKRMDIRSVTSYTIDYRNAINDKHKQLERYKKHYPNFNGHYVCLYFEDPSLYKEELVRSGYNRYKGLHEEVLIKEVWCVVKGKGTFRFNFE